MAKGTTNSKQRDRELHSKAFDCIKFNKNGDVAIDYHKYALATGLADAKSARASWRALNERLDEMSDDSQSDAGDGTPKKRKADSDGADGNGEKAATPVAKKTRTPAKAKAKAIPKTAEEDNDRGEAVVKAEKDGEEGGELAAAAPAVTTP